MADLHRVRIKWTGAGVTGAGVSTFYLDTPAAGFIADIADLFVALKPFVPASVTWEFPGSGEIIDSATGDAAGVWTDGSTFTSPGSASDGGFAGGVGGRLRWRTNGVTNNRRVVGSTFIVPLSRAAYDTFGTIASSFSTPVKTAQTAFIASQSGSFVIWTRPNSEHAGVVSSVLTGDVQPKVSWLTTRKN